MSAPIEVLLSRLDGVKKVRANGWMSRCPAHGGDGQSLAITDKDNGYILIHCFAHECEAGDILGAVGMTVSDLFPERLPERHYSPPKHAVPAVDVLRVMRHELTMVEVLMSDFLTGSLTHDSLDRAHPCLQRLQKALDLCDG